MPSTAPIVQLTKNSVREAALGEANPALPPLEIKKLVAKKNYKTLLGNLRRTIICYTENNHPGLEEKIGNDNYLHTTSFLSRFQFSDVKAALKLLRDLKAYTELTPAKTLFQIVMDRITSTDSSSTLGLYSTNHRALCNDLFNCLLLSCTDTLDARVKKDNMKTGIKTRQDARPKYSCRGAAEARAENCLLIASQQMRITLTTAWNECMKEADGSNGFEPEDDSFPLEAVHADVESVSTTASNAV